LKIDWSVDVEFLVFAVGEIPAVPQWLLTQGCSSGSGVRLVTRSLSSSRSARPEALEAKPNSHWLSAYGPTINLPRYDRLHHPALSHKQPSKASKADPLISIEDL